MDDRKRKAESQLQLIHRCAAVSGTVTVGLFAIAIALGEVELDFGIAGLALFALVSIVPGISGWICGEQTRTSIGMLLGLFLGMYVGDALLGLPWNGPIADVPDLKFQRMIGPLLGVSVGATLGILAAAWRNDV